MSKEKLKNENHTSHFALHTSKQNGITLIALIITIIVMLILTGVTLIITLGDNGLVNKAKDATEATQVAMDRELLLSAVVGTIDNNGEINLGAIVLPEGFTGSNGTYTSSNGHTFTVSQNGEVVFAGSDDDIIENGGEVETVNLDGKYFSFMDMTEIEIKGNKLICSEDSDYLDGEMVVDHTTKTGTFIVNYKPEENGKTYEPGIMPFKYETVVENNKIVNVFFYAESSTYTVAIACKDMNALEYDLEGDYISEDGNSKLTFNASAPVYDSNDNLRNFYIYHRSEDSWVIDTHGGDQFYFKINNKYFIDYYLKTVSEDKNTVIWNNKTYTKQIAE